MKLDLQDFFSLIEPLRYFATKLDTPFFNENFPIEYPTGRDVDIICHPNDFKTLCQTCEDKIIPFENLSRRIVHDNINHVRYRIESSSYFLRSNPSPYDKLINGVPMTKLHFQVDVSTIFEEDYKDLTEDFLNSVFEELDFTNGIKILPKEKEVIFRFLFWKKSPKATHHGEYISRNADRSILQNFKDGELKNFCENILNRIER